MINAERFWDQQSSTYDDTESRYAQIFSRIIENTRKHLSDSDIVLDFACGTGSIAIEIADTVKEVYAIDISSGMIDVAKRKAAERHINNIRFAQSSLSDEQYQRESFDVFLAFNILHLLDDTPAYLQRIGHLLKPGGLFISATPSLGEKPSLFSTALSFLSKLQLVPYVKNFSIAELEAAIATSGFHIAESEIVSHAPVSNFVVARKKL